MNPIVAEAADSYALTYAEITGKGRARDMVKARTAVSMALRKRGLSYPQIGRLLGGRDHSSIIYYCKGCTHFLREPYFAALVEKLVGMPFVAPPSAPIVKIVERVVEKVVYVPKAEPARRRFALGQIDGEELAEEEHREMMARGSMRLAGAIRSQFVFGVAA
jgi:hypothetical protein